MHGGEGGDEVDFDLTRELIKVTRVDSNFLPFMAETLSSYSELFFNDLNLS